MKINETSPYVLYYGRERGPECGSGTLPLRQALFPVQDLSSPGRELPGDGPGPESCKTELG